MYFLKEDGIMDDCRVSILYQIGLNTILKAASRPLKITYLAVSALAEKQASKDFECDARFLNKHDGENKLIFHRISCFAMLLGP